MPKHIIKAHRRIVLVIFLSIIVVIGTIALILVTSCPGQNELRRDKLYLNSIRRDIHMFKDLQNRHPESLMELYKYAKENEGLMNPTCYTLTVLGGDLFEVGEHNTFDGTGGFYYNSSLGEVRINLKGPLKKYFRWYLGPERNEILSQW